MATGKKKQELNGRRGVKVSDDEEEGEDEGEEDEEGYYQLRKPNQDCHSLAIESHSCQTYEDHATQTEDEEDEEDERDISEEEALPYHQGE